MSDDQVCIQMVAVANMAVNMCGWWDSNWGNVSIKEDGMKIRLYSNPKGTGWMGWIENCKEQVIGFIRLDGSISWEW